MTIGDNVTWKRQVRSTTRIGKRYRITTGVIIDGRLNRAQRQECKVHILFHSGSMPQKIEDQIWVTAEELTMYRCDERQHSKKSTPLQLARRQQNKKIKEVREDEQRKSSREKKQLLREIQNLEKAD